MTTTPLASVKTAGSTDPAPVHLARLGDTGETFAAPADQTLMASMGQAGLSWPVSCRNGTCRTCLGRLVHGQVAHGIPWPGLSAEEKRDGYCLACIAKPLGDVVLVPA